MLPQNWNENGNLYNIKSADMSHNSHKILFKFYSEVLEKEMAETLWATEVDRKKGHFKIDNIPFYVPNIATDDLIQAEYLEKEKTYFFKEIIQFSGNSIVRVIRLNKNFDTKDIRQKLNKLGCNSEQWNEDYFVIEIPQNVKYKAIRKELNKLEKKQIISFAEAVLSDAHQK